MKKLILLLLLTGCITYDRMISKPEEFYILPNFYMEWNGEYPVDTWRASIKLNESFYDGNGHEYRLTKYPQEDSIYILEIKLNLE